LRRTLGGPSVEASERRGLMTKRAVLRKAVVVAVLSASLVGVTAGTAGARPTTGQLRDSCTGAGGSWTMEGYHMDGRYHLYGYTCSWNDGGPDHVYDSAGRFIGLA
jgi:hypothetical protein